MKVPLPDPRPRRPRPRALPPGWLIAAFALASLLLAGCGEVSTASVVRRASRRSTAGSSRPSSASTRARRRACLAPLTKRETLARSQARPLSPGGATGTSKPVGQHPLDVVSTRQSLLHAARLAGQHVGAGRSDVLQLDRESCPGRIAAGRGEVHHLRGAVPTQAKLQPVHPNSRRIHALLPSPHGHR
jgi:hypothetical protein